MFKFRFFAVQMLTLAVLHFCSLPVYAQSEHFDTACLEPAFIQVLASSYKSNQQGYANLYSGPEYIGTYPGTTGHPYLEWDTLQQGFVKYNGTCYPNIGLHYDLVRDEVVLKGKQNLLLSLVPGKVDFFSMKGRLFIDSKLVPGIQNLPEKGFYEVLYSGVSTILVKRKKKIERSSRVEDPLIFKQYNDYYVKKDGVFHPVGQEKDLLHLFADQRDDLKKYLRKNKLNFKSGKENSIPKAAAYYDQLKS